jgi:hypothetical protein
MSAVGSPSRHKPDRYPAVRRPPTTVYLLSFLAGEPEAAKAPASIQNDSGLSQGLAGRPCGRLEFADPGYA